jgi:hypothetical protein
MLALLLTLIISAFNADQADVAGNWRVEFVVPTGERMVMMTINQKESALSGRVINEDGEFPVEGKIAGDKVTIEWSVPEQGEQLRIIMDGTIQGDDINGVARLAGVGEGSLFAHRLSRNP